MEAGRKLDALIAQKVMGRKVGIRAYDKRLPHYSTDIAATWEVVKLFQCGIHREDFSCAACCMDLQLSDWDDAEGNWFCSFYAPDLRKHHVQAKTAPLAICFAALRAMGVKNVD